MAQLSLLRNLLEDPPESDDVLQFYLDHASTVICEIRNSDKVEPKYETVQVQMAIELFNKRGAEGQEGHSENGINRSWGTAEISEELLSKVTPRGKTPYTPVRVIE